MMPTTAPRDCIHDGRHHHGTRLMYKADDCKCTACLAACATESRTRYRLAAYGQLRSQQLDPTGASRRLQALARVGWSSALVSSRAGVQADHLARIRSGRKKWITPATHAAISRAYNELWDQIPPRPAGRAASAPARTQLYAARQGWLPPLAWDDIDNDPGPAIPESTSEIDEIAVELACAGQPVTLTRAERIEATRILHGRGLTDPQIGERLGASRGAVFKDRVRFLVGAA